MDNEFFCYCHNLINIKGRAIHVQGCPLLQLMEPMRRESQRMSLSFWHATFTVALLFVAFTATPRLLAKFTSRPQKVRSSWKTSTIKERLLGCRLPNTQRQPVFMAYKQLNRTTALNYSTGAVAHQEVQFIACIRFPCSQKSCPCACTRTGEHNSRSLFKKL